MKPDIEVIDIENKPYDYKCSEQEIQAIENRVNIYEDDIVVIQEMPIITVFSVNIIFQKLISIVWKKKQIRLIIDYTESQRPDARVRAEFNAKFSIIQDKIKHLAVYTGNNMLFDIVVKYTMNTLNYNDFSVYKDFEEALKEVRNVEKS